MELYERELLIARIQCGYLKIQKHGYSPVFFFQPNTEVRYESNILYNEAFHTCIDEGVLTIDEMLDYQRCRGYLTEKDDEHWEVLPKHVEHWKVEIYQSLFRSNYRAECRKYLREAEKRYDEILSKRHRYDFYTAEGIANYIRMVYIISQCCKYKNKRVYDFKELSKQYILSVYYAEQIDDKEYRELAHTSPWTEIWSCNSSNRQIFTHIPLTLEQQRLVMWSRLYDNVAESMDCPHDTVIDDDDMLDGWLILQRRKREDDKKAKQGEEFTSNAKIAKGDMIFIQADTAEDAKRINEMNTIQARRTKEARSKQIREQGVVREQDFKDSQQKMREQITKQYVNRMKS